MTANNRICEKKRQQSVRTGQMFDRAVCYRFFTGQSQSIKFFAFFESSIMHNAQDRTGLAPREPGVLFFG
jgi:hypothetical protein